MSCRKRCATSRLSPDECATADDGSDGEFAVGNPKHCIDRCERRRVSDGSTVARHLDVLEAAFLIRRLRLHFANLSKRLVRTPKIYVRDSGLLHFLGGLRAESDLETWHKRGASFEGFVVEELLAQAGDRVARPYAAFWRTSAGVEVDLLVGTEANLFPVEVKSGSKIDARDLRGMKTAMKDLGLRRGWVVLGDGERQDLGDGVEAVPWPLIARGEVRLPI